MLHTIYELDQLSLIQVIDTIPQWPPHPVHVQAGFNPVRFGSVFDSVITTFVKSGADYAGCQAYAGVHKSRNESRETVSTMFTGHNIPSASDFLQLAESCTLIIREAYKIIPFCSEVRNIWISQFPCHINTNLYLSLQTSDAFPAHQDPHHVFALQLTGSKKWYFSTCESSEFHHTQTIPMTEVLCQSGDILFIPKGISHRAKAVDLSVHLSVSIEEDKIMNSRTSKLMES